MGKAMLGVAWQGKVYFLNTGMSELFLTNNIEICTIRDKADLSTEQVPVDINDVALVVAEHRVLQTVPTLCMPKTATIDSYRIFRDVWCTGRSMMVLN